MNPKKILIIVLLLVSSSVFAQDPNFHIYLCFGQSNMEGQGTIETQDKTVNPRFKVMEATDCSNLNRKKGGWYTATPPLCRCYTGLSPVDYFGRTMVENLPDSIKVGVINVSIAGCKIELFDKDNYKTYTSSITEDWLKNIIAAYNGNPYAYLLELAQLAQKDGVIKGFLIHQGESNTGDSKWPSKVKGIYDNLITDLGLDAAKVSLLAGEVVNADQGGICASMNSIIATLPKTIPNAHVISSKGCTDAADNLHFNAAGYRELGKRYAVKMLSLMGIDVTKPQDPPVTVVPKSFYFEPECATLGENWEIVTDALASNNNYVTVKAGTQSLAAAAGSEGALTVPFTLDSAGSFSVYARLNCPTADDDSYWVKMDNGDFVMCNGLGTSGWQWLKLNSYDLTAGKHILTITYREDGAKLDKLCVSNQTTVPDGMGKPAENLCNPKLDIDDLQAVNGYALEQNYPNPFNEKTMISFELPASSYVSLKVYNALGAEVNELAGKKYPSGKHIVEFDAQNLSKGIYFYTLKANNFSASKKMVILEH
jgi:hypothetical protein